MCGCRCGCECGCVGVGMGVGAHLCVCTHAVSACRLKPFCSIACQAQAPSAPSGTPTHPQHWHRQGVGEVGTWKAIAEQGTGTLKQRKPWAVDCARTHTHMHVRMGIQGSMLATRT